MTTVTPPRRRECERCGRTEVWDEKRGGWTAAEVDGARLRGEPHCLHEWDITGTYNPLTSRE